MKPHELENRDKTRAKNKGKTKSDKNQIEKKRKGNKTLSQKAKRGGEKNLTKRQ
jgi:hypothetical protein